MEEIEKSRIEEIKRLHNEILGFVKLSLENAIRIGQLLTDQKEELGHGEFIRWIKDNLPFTDRAARRYMGLWRYRDTLKSENVSDLSSAYQLLVEHKLKEGLPSTPLKVPDSDGKETEYRDNVKKAIFVSDEKFNQSEVDVTIKKGEMKFLKGVDWMILGGKEPPGINNFPNSKLFFRQRKNDSQRIGEQPERVEERKSEAERDGTDESRNSSSKEPFMMVNGKEFSSVIKKCKKFVPEREFVPDILKHFRFQGNTIKATDRWRGIAYKFEGFDFGDFFAHSDSLIVLFSKLKNEARLQFGPKNIKITSGNFETRIPTYQENDESFCGENFRFPETPTDVHDLPKNFLDPVREVYFAAERDPTTFQAFSGIFVDKNVFYAINNLVIAKYSSDLDLDVSFTMPNELLNIVRADENSPFGYAIDGKHFWLCFNEYSAYAPLIENPLPISRLKEIFDSIPKSETFCEFDKSAMAQALKRVEPFTEGTSRRMHVKVSRNKITLEGKIGETLGECSEVVDCEGGGDWSFIVSHREFEPCTSRMVKFQCHPGLRRQRDVLYFRNENLECLLYAFEDEN
jgi:hypothetical protein